MIASEGFVAQGFAFDERSGPFVGVVVLYEGAEIGSTTICHHRPDVAATIAKGSEVECGFRVMATLPVGVSGPLSIDICAFFKSGKTWVQRVHVVAGTRNYRNGPYGTLLHGDLSLVYGRADIYSVGPPSPTASLECLALLQSYLGPGDRVIDIGCGIGAYAPPLLAAGVTWEGCEVNVTFVDQLRERGLSISQLVDESLPFEAGAFETAMCIEVLEHIDDCASFLSEVRRITRRKAFFSVPNAEAIPVLADQLVVPWHLLEADHKNFFTRGGLRATLGRHFRYVEVIPYGVMPLQSSNGSPVYYHLFAVAIC